MRNRFSCVCCSVVGGRLIRNRLSEDRSPLNQFHLNSFLSFCPPKLPLSLISSSQNWLHKLIVALDGWRSTCNRSARGWPPIVITLLLSHHRCPTAVVQLPSLNCCRCCCCHTTLTKASSLSRWQRVPTEFSFSLNQRSTSRTTVCYTYK
jgi:hypothetical protein